MNIIKSVSVLFLIFTLHGASQTWKADYATLLDKYATKSGVKYSSWHKNKADLKKLDSVVDAIGKAKPSGSEDDKLSFYLNAYNAWMLKKALSIYPVDKPISKDPKIFTRNDIKVANQKISLDHLENKIIRKDFTEARIHFALNCASVSCPPLHDEPFTGKTLDSTLEKLTKKFINSSEAVEVKGNSIKLNEIFKWFAKDFKKDSGSVKSFIKKYRKLPSGSIDYLSYNWKLNQA